MAAYALAIFTGAFLLFQVQPLSGKYLLPWFGGAPGVWTTCLLFFQAVLLAGYLYAHLSTRWLKPRAQVLLHLTLLGLSFATLPIIPSDTWKPVTPAHPALHLLALLAVSVGLPYFVLSSTAPLLQHWFTLSQPRSSPYRLYALSNTGSLLALLSYPAVFENWFRRSTQAYLWSAGLGLYALACAVCAVKCWRANGVEPKPRDRRARRKPRSGRDQSRSNLQTAPSKLLWLLLPTCASVLLLAVTNKSCQDVAAVPLLWVLPLTAYLLSFIICFERPGWYGRWWFGPALFTALGTMGWMAASPSTFPATVQIVLYIAGLFVCCMVCHGEVYRLKPDPVHLTHFYLMLAAGGALGGLFVAILAPVLFPDYYELHWGLLLCGFLFLLVCAREQPRPLRKWPVLTWSSAAVALAALGAVLWASAREHATVRVCRVRNFYGVLNVYRHNDSDPNLNLVELVHGRTTHGLQFLQPSRADQPTLYYTPASGVGRAFRVLSAGKRRIGVVGLGAGTLAAYGHAGDSFRFYELNPAVERLARTYFTYLRDSPAQTSVVLGDARLSLEREPPQNFDLLVLDAFDGDSIPIHLLTQEAFELYQRHLQPNGLIAVHISNASLDLEPVISRLAARLGYTARVIDQPESNEVQGILPSTWVLMSQDPAFAAARAIREAARPAQASAGGDRLWTDDFSGLFAVLRWPYSGSATPAQAGRYPEAAPDSVPKRQNYLATQIAAYRQAVSLQPGSSVALNNLAFLLATAPDPTLRDGAEAVKYAQQACLLTGYSNAATLSTLAAAYAEAGQFDDAVATTEKACKVAADQTQPALLEENLHLLDLYRRKQPYHQRAP
ncbi:MAG TPA: fused MFS/spermidine synthase [Verrucomicrobiae bacterium]|nr:fused MFS/spermidine synthase [Verrucomicrobiae bacterium]